MAFSNNNSSIEIHEQCTVAPPPDSTPLSLPLTFFDLFWLRFHPVERIFFYALPSHDDPSFFFHKVVPNLKTSLSLALQSFLPLAGNMVWPSNSKVPVLQYNPGDGVALIVAESNSDFKDIIDNSPREASQSRPLVPPLEILDSRASIISLQITLFPGSGFSIGISNHHAVLDGKSVTMFMKAWASLCHRIGEEFDPSPSLAPELIPFLDREVVKDPNECGVSLANGWTEMLFTMFPNEERNPRSLRILTSQPRVEDTVRATFVLTRGDLEKVRKKVLSKWGTVKSGEEASIPPPTTLSTFVLTCSYVLVCIAKATYRVLNKEKFAFPLTADCRARSEPPIPENYLGNCVWVHFLDAKPGDFIEEDGVVLVAESIYSKIKMLGEGGSGGFDSTGLSTRYMILTSQGVEIMGVAGSNKFGVYGIDFGWGRPEKVEITSVDRGLAIGLAESRDGNGGVEFGLVLKKDVMDLFTTLFHAGLCHD